MVMGAYVIGKRGQEDVVIQQGWAYTPNRARVTLENTYACCGLTDNSINSTDIGDPCPSYASGTCLSAIVASVQAHLVGFGIGAIVLSICMVLTLIVVVFLYRGISVAKRRYRLDEEITE